MAALAWLGWTAPLAALLGIGCAGPGATVSTSRIEAPSEASPTLWRALRPDGGEAFYLLGSVHLGRTSMLPLPARIDRAYARADELVLEVDFDELESESAMRLARRYGFVQSPGTLRDRVSEDTLDALEDYLDDRGDSLATYLQFEPWFLATHLTKREALRLGLDPEFGVDQLFATRAARKKPISALETAESQFALLAGLPQDVQERMLLDALRRTDELQSETEGLIRAWERGDDAQLAQIAFRSLHRTPELDVFYEQIVFGRNESMAKRLAVLSQDGKLRFVVVGAAHLIGKRGIPALLRDYGFRLQKAKE